MRLEAEAENCCASTFVLRLDGQPISKYETRLWGPGLDVALLGRVRLELVSTNWSGTHFVLREAGSEQVVVEAEHAGLFSSSWDLRLRSAPATMERAGWFDSAMVVRRGDWELARVDRAGACDRGWALRGEAPLAREDVLLIGLMYHALRQRQAGAAAAAGS